MPTQRGVLSPQRHHGLFPSYRRVDGNHARRIFAKMNMDAAKIKNKAKNLNKARTKRLANSLRRWTTSLNMDEHVFQQS